MLVGCLFVGKFMRYLTTISEFLAVKDGNLIHLFELIYSVACSLRPTFFFFKILLLRQQDFSMPTCLLLPRQQSVAGWLLQTSDVCSVRESCSEYRLCVSIVLLEGVFLTPVLAERDGCRDFWSPGIADETRRTLTLPRNPQLFLPTGQLTVCFLPFDFHFSFIIWVSFCFYWICMHDHCSPESSWPLCQGHDPAIFLATWQQKAVLCHREAPSLFYGNFKVDACLFSALNTVWREGQEPSTNSCPRYQLCSHCHGWTPWLSMRAQPPSVPPSCLSWSWMSKDSSYLVCHGCSILKWHVLSIVSQASYFIWCI